MASRWISLFDRMQMQCEPDQWEWLVCDERTTDEKFFKFEFKKKIRPFDVDSMWKFIVFSLSIFNLINFGVEVFSSTSYKYKYMIEQEHCARCSANTSAGA